tara:strand:- start:467 stop:667 length:201 start_codon:yes stop_codon:yes gene_type:complete
LDENAPEIAAIKRENKTNPIVNLVQQNFLTNRFPTITIIDRLNNPPAEFPVRSGVDPINANTPQIL